MPRELCLAEFRASAGVRSACNSIRSRGLLDSHATNPCCVHCHVTGEASIAPKPSRPRWFRENARCSFGWLGSGTSEEPIDTVRTAYTCNGIDAPTVSNTPAQTYFLGLHATWSPKSRKNENRHPHRPWLPDLMTYCCRTRSACTATA